MKRILLALTVVTAIGVGGLVAAQTPAPKADEHAAHHPAKAATAPAATAPRDAQSASGAMPGGGMRGGGMMAGGMCPMMGGANTKVDVKNTDKGVTIPLTSAAAAPATRLQKMA